MFRVARVQRVFADNLRLFETLEVAALCFDARGDALSMCEALRDGSVGLPVDLPDTAQILDPPARHGYLGLVTRADLPVEWAAVLFAADAPEVAGPVRYDGRFWVLVRLMPRRADLTAAVYAYCEAMLDAEGEAQPGTAGT